LYRNLNFNRILTESKNKKKQKKKVTNQFLLEVMFTTLTNVMGYELNEHSFYCTWLAVVVCPTSKSYNIKARVTRLIHFAAKKDDGNE